MAGNTFGKVFRLTTFGESHGPAIGAVIDGCPAGLWIDEDFIMEELSRRKPGLLNISSPRKEEDTLEILSGVYQGTSLGSPIAFIIRNKDATPEEYSNINKVYRPSHGDFTTKIKYGLRDPRGGGRLSGRETAARVAGGAVAKLFLRKAGIEVDAITTRIGPLMLPTPPEDIRPEQAEDSVLRCPDPDLTKDMITYLEQLRNEGDTTGGEVQCHLRNVPAGLGEPVFDKLHADLAKAVMSIGACKGFEIGSGFRSAAMKGSEHNDPFQAAGDRVLTRTNHSGGIQGGISNGMDIWFRAAFKPVPSIALTQKSVDEDGIPKDLKITGRHDVCVIPRVIPVVEAMAALVLADHLLRQRSART